MKQSSRGDVCLVTPDRKPRAVWFCGRVRRGDCGSWFVAVYRVEVFLQSFAATLGSGAWFRPLEQWRSTAAQLTSGL